MVDLNESSYTLMIFSHLPSVSMCRIILVFLLPCSPFSNLSSQSKPSSGCVFLFSVISIGNTSLHFSVFTSTVASPLNFIGFLFTSTKHYAVLRNSIGVNIGGLIVTGYPVSMINSIACPRTNSIAL